MNELLQGPDATSVDDLSGSADIAVATGRLAEEKGDASRAMNLCSKAIAISSFLDGGSSEADARSNLAFVQALGNNLSKARQTYQQALEMDPSLSKSSKALQQLNNVAEKAGQSKVVGVMYSMED